CWPGPGRYAAALYYRGTAQLLTIYKSIIQLSMMDLVYLDNNATTQPAPQVVAEMMPYLTQWYGNPSSVHRFGQRARQAIDEARARIAALLHCADAELLFTAGGTESINTAIRGLLAARSPRKKILTTTVEHSATRELCQQLAKENAA